MYLSNSNENITYMRDRLLHSQPYKINYGLDIFKLVCAFLIVFMHTYNKDLGMSGDLFYHVITPIGVPFFFIVSGYLYSKGLLRYDANGLIISVT